MRTQAKKEKYIYLKIYILLFLYNQLLRQNCILKFMLQNFLNQNIHFLENFVFLNCAVIVKNKSCLL